MSYLGDTLTVGLILVLLFGSVALYLYTRVQQTEQKVNLLESIVLDLKLTGELSPFSDASHQTPLTPTPTLTPTLTSTLTPTKTLSPISTPISSPIVSEYKAFEEEDSEPLSSEEVQDVEIVSVNVNESENIVSYDSMTLKELQSLVRSRGLTAERGAKKNQLIELVKRADASAEVKPGSMSSSLSLEPFSNDEE